MRRSLRQAILSSLFAGLTAVLAYVAIPLPISPVPVTLQTLGVMSAGLVLGPWWGMASAALYLALGAVGFPVFAGGRAGPGVLAGPTGGYLLGFIAAAGIVGWVSYRRTGFWACFVAACLGGIGAVHLLGTLWLAVLTKRPLAQAFMLGSVPYIPGDLLKALVAAAMGSRLRHLRPLI